MSSLVRLLLGPRAEGPSISEHLKDEYENDHEKKAPYFPGAKAAARYYAVARPSGSRHSASDEQRQDILK